MDQRTQDHVDMPRRSSGAGRMSRSRIAMAIRQFHSGLRNFWVSQICQFSSVRFVCRIAAKAPLKDESEKCSIRNS